MVRAKRKIEPLSDIRQGFRPDGLPREWKRGTEMVSLFVASGFGALRVENSINKPKPASLILVGDPGHGKTELLERFRQNRQLSFHTDLTTRGFWRVLREARNGVITHIVATEFQKWFQRKLSVAENTLGMIVQAMEEGIFDVDVGNQHMDFQGVRIGVLGGVTHGTMQKRREFFSEMGFLSRASVIPWMLPVAEKKMILDMQDHGITDDVMPMVLNLPSDPITVDLPVDVSKQINDYVWTNWKEHALRVYNRFRTLAMSSAILEGRDIVRGSDVEHVTQFDDYWHKMIME